MDEIRKRMLKIVCELLCVKEADVQDGSSFSNDLGADDLDFCELVMSFELEFRIAISPEEEEKMRTFGEAAGLVSSKLENRKER